MFELCRQHKFEGIVAKHKTSNYFPGVRSANWQKIKYFQTEEFSLIGYREGDGFIVAKEGKIVGLVQYGFARDHYKYIDRAASVERVETVRKKKTYWYASPIKVRIEFMNWTSSGLLRAPVFREFV